jgi:phosphohistidine swiveling domain-containing protein
MTVFSVDSELPGEWYAGYDIERFQRVHPSPIEPLKQFSKEDEARFWLLEGHWNRGLTPLCMSVTNDVVSGTQYGASLYQLPTSKGNAGRISGVHAYVTDIGCCSEWEVGSRAMEVEGRVGPAVMNFPQIWEARLQRIRAANEHFESTDMGTLDLAGVKVYLEEAFGYHYWVWGVHFEVMDALIGNYFQFRAICVEAGLDDATVSRFLQGYDTKIMETDRALWQLCASARGTAAAEVMAATAANEARGALTAKGASCAAWLAEVDAFLQTYGWRTDGMCDPSQAPWIEDPTPVFARLKGFLAAPKDHDFVAARVAAVAERDTAIAGARAQLSGEMLAKFEGALGAVQHANFAWWQEEHNFYIDLRSHIPTRRAALRIGELVGVDQFDDCVFLFKDELLGVASGLISYETLRPIVASRREFYVRDRSRRSTMPKVLGTVPAGGEDPVMKEIFGVDDNMIGSVVAASAESLTFKGLAVSSGVATGRARVVVDADGLIDLEPDEILVCVFTAPDWTPAFAIAAGCVADSGGTLSHTAIVSREYRIPCVCGTGVATTYIRTGDLIEVDGNAGTVRILERA